MQTLANYLLVAENNDSARVTSIREATFAVIDSWLAEKGVHDPTAESGSFATLTPGGTGVYSRRTVAGENATLTEVRLEEPSNSGQTFVTAVSIIEEEGKVSVYVHLTVKSTDSVIAPVVTDPRCPWLVRRLFEVTDGWHFGGRELPLPIARTMNGEVNGTALAEIIRSAGRNVPVVVVSEIDWQAVWPGIARDLAFDLTALAGVVTVDEDASWALTDRMGKLQSCYNAAIRLYWPMRPSAVMASFPSSRLWTASTLLSHDHDGRGAARLRATIRRMIMSAAALTVEPPSSIDTIVSYAGRKRLSELEARAASDSEELEIARLFLADNEQLRKDLADAKRELAQWSSRAESAEYALAQKLGAGDEDLSFAGEDEESAKPVAGEVRFYKKMHSTPNHDVLMEVTDCGHTKWQSSNKAEKAKKGLRKLLGVEDWKALHHCGTCTGGGMWRVRW